MLELGLKFTLAYLIGAVMGALVVGRLRGGVDIRDSGSGNPGGTNALRTQGKAFAFWVMLIDVGKGIFAVAVVPGIALPVIAADPPLSVDVLRYVVAFAAILGHVFPVWFDFRGGKGGATAAGLICFLAPGLAIPVLGFWFLIVFFTGYVGIATIGAAALAPIWIVATGVDARWPLLAFAIAVAVLIVYTHRANIGRMVAGNEKGFPRYFGLK